MKTKFFDNTEDLLIISNNNNNNNNKRDPRLMLCSHAPINYSFGYLNYIAYLAIMLQASWHIAEGN